MSESYFAIFCVILGWMLSSITVYFNDFIKLRSKAIGMINLLILEHKSVLQEARGIISSDVVFLTNNNFWVANRLLFFQILPKEALIFDKYLSALDLLSFKDIDSAEIQQSKTKDFFSIANETKTNLEKSLKNWQEPLYKTLFLHAINKL